MPHYRHKQQRPGHDYRYGLAHWLRHQRGETHVHRRSSARSSPGHRDAGAAGTSTAVPGQGRGSADTTLTQTRRTISADRRRQRSLARRRSGRRWIWVGIGVVVLVIAGLAVSAAISILQARHALEQAKATFTQLTADPHALLSATNRSAALSEIDRASTLTLQAQHDLESSPGVTAMWILPYLHSQRAALLRLTTDIEATAISGKALLQGVNTLAAQSHGTTISLPALAALQHTMAVSEARQAPMTSWSGGLLPLLGPIQSAKASFLHADNRLLGLLSEGQRATSYAQVFLGAKGPRTYLLAAENNAEMRDQGAVLSYALVTADGGAMHIQSPASVAGLELSSPANYPIPAGTAQVFGRFEPTLNWQSANATAAFPWTGGDLQAMYQTATGQHVDGVIAMDVPTLASLLQLTGPVTVAGIGQPVTAQNVASILLSQLYAGYPAGSTQAARHELLSSVADAAVAQMRASHVDVAALADALAHDAAGRHLLLWDSVPAYEATIRKFGASGAIDATDPSRTFHVAVENGSATKLDYYVQVSQSEKVVVTRDGDADVTTTVTMDNTAPVGAAPSYALGPDYVNTFTPGEYIARVYLWGPRGSTQYGSVAESGLELAQTTQQLNAGQTASVQFTTVIPHAVRNGQLHLVFVPQPRLNPVPLTVHMFGAGVAVRGPAVVHAPLTKTRSYTWSVGS